MTAGIFFVDGKSFFISSSCNITLTMVRHIEDRKTSTILKYLKEIYMYYLIRGFQITTLHVDGEFAPLQALIQEMPGGQMFNLSSASEHITEIERQK